MEKVKSIKEIVDYAAKTFGDKDAFKYKQRKDIISKSFNDIKNDSEAFSIGLEKLDMVGKHIAVIGPTSYEWLIAYLGTVNSGSVIVPIDRELPAEDVCDSAKRFGISNVA